MKSEKGDQPISIIGALFGFCVTFWAKNLADYMSDYLVVVKKSLLQLDVENLNILDRLASVPTQWTDVHGQWFITLFSGLLFLIDILCVLWWFSKYIYRVQSTVTLGTQFLDFSLVGMMSLAANRWDNSVIFLTATTCGSAILLLRFYWIINGPDATDTDKQILSAARWGLCVALGVVALVFLIIGAVIPFIVEGHKGIVAVYKMYVMPAIPGVLSAIGIGLTWWLKDKIEVAVAIHDRAEKRFIPMTLHWPEEIKKDPMVRDGIISNTADGLMEFRNLFEKRMGLPKHERVRSRVHPEADLRVQSYILSIPSWKSDRGASEVKHKAFMVAVSHWLDDLLDGRNEAITFQILKGLPNFGLPVRDSHVETPEKMFEAIYNRLIIQHTDPFFYDALIQQINQAAVSDHNRRYLYFGLNRVAIGSVIFGPKIHRENRDHARDRHIEALEQLIGSRGEWSEEVGRLIRKIRNHEVGKILLSLTTKTDQEIAMASEEEDVNFALTLLYSLLYAPLLYFHDIDDELDYGEMVAVDAFDVNHDIVVPWLKECRRLSQDDRVNDRRKSYRLQQMEMAFNCFAGKLPQPVRDTLAEIYCSPTSPPSGHLTDVSQPRERRQMG